ncbi:MAG: hypothetical protein L3J83_01715 [Proteobacteria bacterium]|nr:hypothetical protein [Pseudomonadota bacterium]
MRISITQLIACLLALGLVSVSGLIAGDVEAKLEKLNHGRFYLKIKEKLLAPKVSNPKAEEIATTPLKKNYPEATIERLLVTHGFKRTRKRDRASLIITGQVHYQYSRTTQFKFKTGKMDLEHQYYGSGKLSASVVDMAPKKSGEPQIGAPNLGKNKKNNAAKGNPVIKSPRVCLISCFTRWLLLFWCCNTYSVWVITTTDISKYNTSTISWL